MHTPSLKGVFLHKENGPFPSWAYAHEHDEHFWMFPIFFPSITGSSK